MVKNMFFVPKERARASWKKILKERKDRKMKEIEEIERNIEKTKNKQKL